MKFLWSILIISLFIACNNGSKTLPSSSGRNGEILLVIDTVQIKGLVGKALDQYFGEFQLGLPQNEAKYKLIPIPPHAFSHLFMLSKNILLISKGTDKKAGVITENDKWARDQFYMEISGGSWEEIAAIIQKNNGRLVAKFEYEEEKRMQLELKANLNKELQDKLVKEHGLSMDIPNSYVSVIDTSNFIWLRKDKTVGPDKHEIIQSIMVYQFEYNSDSTFTSHYLCLKRDSVTKLFIHGSAENSFMKVYHNYAPYCSEKNFHNNYLFEMRGLWNMQNDFMGGPFLNYTIVDQSRNRVICVDGFVYAPKFDKISFVKELEAIMKTLKF